MIQGDEDPCQVSYRHEVPLSKMISSKIWKFGTLLHHKRRRLCIGGIRAICLLTFLMLLRSRKRKWNWNEVLPRTRVALKVTWLRANIDGYSREMYPILVSCTVVWTVGE